MDLDPCLGKPCDIAVSVDKRDSIDASRDRDQVPEEILLLYRIRRSAGWTAFFTTAIAIGAAAAAYFFWQQLGVAEDQLEQMENLYTQAKRSSDAVQRQAAASEKALQSLSELIRQNVDAANTQANAVQKIAEVATRQQTAFDRPWVGVESVTAAALIPGQPLALKVLIRNSGRTPALDVRGTLYSAVSAVADTAVPNIPACDSCTQIVLLPSGVFNYDVTVNGDLLSKEKTDRIKEGTDTILLFGRLEYTDIAAAAHSTTVCMKYAPKSGAFGACARGNELN